MRGVLFDVRDGAISIEYSKWTEEKKLSQFNSNFYFFSDILSGFY